LLEWYAADEGSENSGEEGEVTTTTATTPVPSMRHGGCINTAAWLDCGWRLSTVGTSSSCEAVLTDDCPTQLVTSGDDHLVKFWDVRHAMGTTSPLAGGAPTVCPFSAPHCPDQDETRRTWKRHYAKTKSPYLAGSVLPLATLQTGHRGNVFHVTPLHGKPGKVATCGADGFLRLTDLETGNATEVVSPEFEDDTRGLLPAGLLSLRPGMCFSHHFLSQNTGLLCSERGLRRFDLRLPPREQPTQSLLGGPFRNCKACAIWSPPTSTSSLEGGDSAYVFGK
jgi:WD40 repeat protein